MDRPETEIVECDILIVGGGMAGCGAAYAAADAAKAKGLKVVLVDKGEVERSGPVGLGLNSIDCYIGDAAPEDFVRHVRADAMGLVREDLVLDIARNVNDSVALWDRWGLPIVKDGAGAYRRSGRWGLTIDGRSLKRIVGAAARTALGAGNIFERIYISHLIKDGASGARIAGAIGFHTTENRFYLFKARAVVCASGGATGIWRSHRLTEGVGQFWYAAYNTGSVYRLMMEAGAAMGQMENRLAIPRFRDGYGPIGMWDLVQGARITNVDGANVEDKHSDEKANWAPYGTASPTPTPVRNAQFMKDIFAGLGPFRTKAGAAFQRIYRSMDQDKIDYAIAEGLADYLDLLTVPEAVAQASGKIDATEPETEVFLSEPYLLGSHAASCGAWVSGPGDLAPAEYRWGPNRMTTVAGLFAAGDGVAASPHKFASGSFAEGRIAGASAIAFAAEAGARPEPGAAEVERLKAAILRPYDTYEAGRGASTRAEVNPVLLLPRMGLLRLQKIMDEYCGGPNVWYRTNDPTLLRGLELIGVFKEDLALLAARDGRELLRCWELWDRTLTAECFMRHTLFRKETRWPGYLFRPDYPVVDDTEWKAFVTSRYDAAADSFTLDKVKLISIVE